MVYDYYGRLSKKQFKKRIIPIALLAAVLAAAAAAAGIYLEGIQLAEIGGLQGIYYKNLVYKSLFGAGVFVLVFTVVWATNLLIGRNLRLYMRSENLPVIRLPNLSLALGAAIALAVLTRNFFYAKALNFIHWESFGEKDPIFFKDIGYYVFRRPFLTSLYGFMSVFCLGVIVYTLIYYAAALSAAGAAKISLKDEKMRGISLHILAYALGFFVIKALSYRLTMEGMLFDGFFNVKGAGYVKVNLWLNYYRVMPFLLLAAALLAFFFAWKKKPVKALVTMAVVPAFWLVFLIFTQVFQYSVIKPNEFIYEKEYLKYNVEATRKAYNLDKVRQYVFPDIEPLTPEILERNRDTIDNIRVIDYRATLESDTQLQSNTNFYTFYDGDIVNYMVNGKETPVFIAAREVDQENLPEKSYTNRVFRYTHGYGIVMNPINRFTSEGQADFILSGIELMSESPNIRVTEPRIYYGELTRSYVIVNPGGKGKLKEIDGDGHSETSYYGSGGIRLDPLKRLLFALKLGDINMLISGNVSSGSRLLINRDIVSRAQRAVPFLAIDKDPYIVLTDDGRLLWVLDAYTLTGYYPYSQTAARYGDFNYIRNSVKVIIDAYNGTAEYYVIDKDDPIIRTYSKIYPGVFKFRDLPEDIKKHMRYPELLCIIQSDMLRRYHINPNTGDEAADERKISAFYGNQDLWDIAAVPSIDDSGEVEVESYYVMIKLPGGIGQRAELILLRPFTPSGSKHNLVSWLAVRNSYENYGELVLFVFPKDRNIFGPFQVEVKINQIDSVSKDITLWNQSGSNVFKGNLLVIPIENSVLYVEPIYIRSFQKAIPEVRKIVAGYQEGNEFKYGSGTNLENALKDLFRTEGEAPDGTKPPVDEEPPSDGGRELLDDILSKYEAIKRELEELGELIERLQNR